MKVVKPEVVAFVLEHRTTEYFDLSDMKGLELTGKGFHKSNSGLYDMDTGTGIREIDLLCDLNHRSCSNDIVRAMKAQGCLEVSTEFITPAFTNRFGFCRTGIKLD